MSDPPEQVHVDKLFPSHGVHLSEPPVREWMRGLIAVALLGGFFLEIVFPGVAIGLHWLSFDQAVEFFNRVYPPTIGLVGTAAGFYFGSR